MNLAILDFLRNWVKDIAVMFILLSIVELALPNNNMKRYVNVVIGLMIIIVIISPFIKLINSSFNVEQEIFKSIVEGVQFEYADNSDLQELHERQIKETYINMLKENVKATIDGILEYQVDDIKISIFEDEDNYGNIRDIEIVMAPKDGSDSYDEDTIKTIKIEEIKIDDSNKETEKATTFKDGDKIKDILYEKYNVPKDNIKILIYNKGEEGELSGEISQ